MKEIKFRAQNILDKSEGGGGLVYFGLNEIGAWDETADVFYAKGVPCKISSIQQFTGLTDALRIRDYFELKILNSFFKRYGMNWGKYPIEELYKIYHKHKNEINLE